MFVSLSFPLSLSLLLSLKPVNLSSGEDKKKMRVKGPKRTDCGNKRRTDQSFVLLSPRRPTPGSGLWRRHMELSRECWGGPAGPS